MSGPGCCALQEPRAGKGGEQSVWLCGIHVGEECEREQDMPPPPNMPLWHTDYSELVIVKKQPIQEKLCKQNRSYPFVISEISICKGKL